MDKNLHDDIGDLFRNGIEQMSEPPRQEVWENIERLLDKKDATLYKQKFIYLKRFSVFIIFLILSIATCTVIYFSSEKYKGETKDVLQNIKNSGGEDFIKRDTTTIAYLDKAIEKEEYKKIKVKPRLTNLNANNISEKNSTNFLTSKINSTYKNTIIFANTDKLQNVKPPLAGSFNPYQFKTTDKADTLKSKNLHMPLQPPIKENGLINPEKENIVSKNINKKTSTVHKFSLSIFGAIEKVYYHLSDDIPNPYDSREQIQIREKEDLSFSTGFLLGYQVNKKFTLQAGIGFSSANTNIDPTKIFAEKNSTGKVQYRFNTSTGYAYISPSFSAMPSVGDSLDATRADQTVQYINVPLMAKYKFGDRRVTLAAAAGLSINFLTKAKLNTEVVSSLGLEKESIAKLDGMKAINFSLVVAPALQYNPSKKITLSVIPSFKYSLTPVNKGNIVKTYPYSIGIGIGVTYKF